MITAKQALKQATKFNSQAKVKTDFLAVLDKQLIGESAEGKLRTELDIPEEMTSNTKGEIMTYLQNLGYEVVGGAQGSGMEYRRFIAIGWGEDDSLALSGE